MNGAIKDHSRSVRSLAYRSARRAYCGRVKSVQAIVVSIESLQIRRNHNRLKSLNSSLIGVVKVKHNRAFHLYGIQRLFAAL
ncbi:hypothetical protein, partial [Sinorhizobium meliloti]|uniref:hypothetical protein n=1 Tax=Rhizobium meliloti TaxID=382 RepID=UPI001AECD3CC